MANFITQSISSTYNGKEFTEILFAPQEGSDDLQGIRVIQTLKLRLICTLTQL